MHNSVINSIIGATGTSLSMVTPNEIVSILAGASTLIYMTINLIKLLKNK